MSRAPFAYASDGSMMVMGDGPELFAFGANDGPLWKQFTEGIVVGVGASATLAVSLDTDGRLTSWRGLDGVKQDEHRIDAPDPKGLAMRPDGRCAVIVRDAVLITSPRGGETRVDAKGAAVAAWGARGQLAIGTADGAFTVVEESGKLVGGCSIGSPITGIAFRHPGQWVVASGTKLTLVAGDGKAPGPAIDAGGPTGEVACTGDGAVFAVMTGPQQVAVGEFASNKRLGTVTFQRDVGGIGFGSQAWLAIGLDDAEGNRVDLGTGQICKTEPAPGKVGTKWPMKVEVEPQLVRNAITKVRTGGGPIAKQIDHSGGGGGSTLLYSCLGIVLLSLVCSGCSGAVAGFYYFVYLP